jgi:hypothetical protein
MKSNGPTPSLPSEPGAAATGRLSTPSLPDSASGTAEAAPAFGLSPEGCSESIPEEKNDMDNNIVVEELTDRLPTSELVKIIKGALECGKRNMPFTESDLLRAMTFGASSTYVRVQRDSTQRDSPSSRR